jgi:hypothetical protein
MVGIFIVSNLFYVVFVPPIFDHKAFDLWLLAKQMTWIGETKNRSKVHKTTKLKPVFVSILMNNYYFSSHVQDAL